ncbi:hypothetical protein ACFO0N_03200 [Halobium salinum]|uniref:DUF8215 domain-containing protein n=1 Tax=Halobium salinum TaxID=1364940 RepID=A0ABD5P8H3_9EURY|nr:hypothetical protein [Halobium salinum]
MPSDGPRREGRREEGSRRRRARRGAHRPEAGSDRDGWLTQVVHYGFSQVVVLSTPLVWVVYRTTADAGTVRTAAVVGCLVAAVVVGTLRDGRVDAGPPWPTVTARRLGVGDGYRELVGRVASFSAAVGLAVFCGLVVADGGGSAVAVALVAAVVAALVVGSLPVLAGHGRRGTAVRGALHTGGLWAVADWAGLFAPAGVDATVVGCLLVVAVCALVDLRPAVRREAGT